MYFKRKIENLHLSRYLTNAQTYLILGKIKVKGATVLEGKRLPVLM